MEIKPGGGLGRCPGRKEGEAVETGRGQENERSVGECTAAGIIAFRFFSVRVVGVSKGTDAEGNGVAVDRMANVRFSLDKQRREKR